VSVTYLVTPLENHKRPSLSHMKLCDLHGIISKMNLTPKSDAELLRLCSVQQMLLIDCDGEH